MRSKLELRFSQLHPELPYESRRLPYVKPHTYTPDFTVTPTAFFELKGLFSAADRTKTLLVREQNPGTKIFFVFQNPHLKLGPKSKTTYAAWCEQHGFEWAHESDHEAIQAFIEREK